MKRLLEDRYIVITGAARGLGYHFTRVALEAGATVLMVDILGDLLKERAEAFQAEGLAASYIIADLSQPEAIDQVATTVAQAWPYVNGLINCAALATGVGGVDMMDYDPDLWDRVMTINVKGTWLMTQAMVPFLKKSGAGRVVNIASDTALWGAPRLMAYTASKGAILAMTRSMARELGEFNITVNSLSPGLTLVEATEYVPAERHSLYVNGRAIQREQLPEDVSGTALYLLSDLASFVTGQNIPVNGGFVFN
ncbi:SDR family oxidoreductase [Ignatzschineria cameli]|uniref:Short-chain dehydrogenase n=1 Tax=Ignatzschineria cameli TaxID=2182793 RepID=A0A2U2ARB9_9GAMM|nr:SDR family oxidoreductase [Ignatzschineria cameli]PWD86409.1 short-chain dehydrogenase [Ignatzschineria cameli]PWD89753.1 short-chain dehydrogenase [Ignatzschineria cameli]PWD91403.1 short-chain dehydrogenase [Ignatzschineria cameli]PWD92441.1 short-chain dehydrogenase [Ignatzschineria cameli]